MQTHNFVMDIRFKLFLVPVMVLAFNFAYAQDYQIKTLFNGTGHRGSGGYGALSNKFTTIKGEYANMAEVYGGWYINHRFLLGLGAAAVTNNIPVAPEFSAIPGVEMSYQYGQVGLMTEYTLWSHRAIHLSFQLMNGAGFTVQYMRSPWQDESYWDDYEHYPHDSNWFFVTEPGVKIEMNIFRWLRFSPGVSYRAAFGSEAVGLSDADISGTSVNLTLKFGKF
jgi:hypothetical protein